MRKLYEMKGEGVSVRGIARGLGISRNTVRKYVRSPGLPKQKPRPQRGSKLEPYEAYIRQQLGKGVTNCVVLLRQLRAEGYNGSYSILKDYVRPFRQPPQPRATIRFETEPGEQAQVDFGRVNYVATDGQRRGFWVFVMVLGWSRMLYVEFVPRADLETFIRCHINAFTRLGGVPRHCLYDNMKAVVTRYDEAGEAVFNSRFMDFSLRVGFQIRLCQRYRPQTKGKVESGVKYVKGNFWPSASFATLEELNREAQAWCEGVANVRLHGTTGERPVERWQAERGSLQALVGRERLTPFLRESRLVGRDSYVRWGRGAYGVPCAWVGSRVDVQLSDRGVEIWAGEEMLALHPQARRRGERFTWPGQWDGLGAGEIRPPKEPLVLQLAAVQVEQRSLGEYERILVAGGAR